MMKILSLLSTFFVINAKGISVPDGLEDVPVQVFHVCQGGTVYIPWNVNTISKSHQARPNVTFFLQGRGSQRQRPILTYNGKTQRVRFADNRFMDRLEFAKEHAGVFVKNMVVNIEGTYTVKARIGDLLWTTKTEVVFHFRPFIKEDRLTVSIVDGKHPKAKKGCVIVECGRVDNEGYPALYIIWKHNDTVLLRDPVLNSHWWSTYQVCPPFHGQLVCSIGGFTSMCTFDQHATINLQLPGTGAATGSTSPTSDTILMIVIPVLAIGIPLLILGLWMCVHLCKSPRQRGQHKHNNTTSGNSTVDHNHVSHPSNFIAMDHANLPPFISFQSHHDLPPPILEDLNEESESIATIETTNRLIGLHSPPKQYRDPEETDKKDSAIFKDEEEEEDDDEEEDDSDEDSEDDDEEDDEEEDGEGEVDEDRDVDQETKEKQPLMEDSIRPIVL